MTVGVLVTVGVSVGRGVFVGVSVGLGVTVLVAVAVFVGASVGVLVGVSVLVSVGVGVVAWNVFEKTHFTIGDELVTTTVIRLFGGASKCSIPITPSQETSARAQVPATPLASLSGTSVSVIAYVP